MTTIRSSTYWRVVAWGLLAGLSVWTWMLDNSSELRRTAGVLVPSARDLVYRSSGRERLTLDVYRSDDSRWRARDHPRRPAVLAIHGGSWIGGSKSEYGRQVSRLADHGYVVFAVEYRLARPGSPSWPAVLDDLREAVRWVRSHADDWQVDPARIVALGSSAGGHLAQLLGTESIDSTSGGISSRVQAVITFYGPSDLAELLASRSLKNDPLLLLVGANPPDGSHELREASPRSHVTVQTCPMLLIHGTDDAWVPPGQSRLMAERLSESGVIHRLILVEGARHGFEFQVGVPERRDLLPDLLAFLEDVWQARSQH
jgi:acetyl esterase/lipase